MAIPLLQASSAISYITTGTSLVRTLPTGWQPGWVALVACQTANEVMPAPGTIDASHLTGFAEAATAQGTGTAAAAGSVRLTTFWKRLVAGDTQVKVYKPSGADHLIFRIFYFNNVFATGNPFIATAGGIIAAAQLGVSIPGSDTAGFTDVLTINLAAHGVDTWNPIGNGSYASTGLANLTEIMNESAGAGFGGGFVIVTGEKAAPGTYGPTTTSLLTGNASKQGLQTLALRGTGSVVVLAASDFGCGAECGQDAVGLGGHWDGQGGTPFVSQTEVARNNGRSWLSAPVSDVSFRWKGVTGAKRIARAAFRWDVALPDTDCELIRMHTAGNANSPELRFRAATSDVVAAVGNVVSPAVPVIVGQFYEFGIYADVSVNPRVVKLALAGVNQGQATLAVASDVFTRFEIGASCGNPVTARVAIDDIRTGPDLAQYPFPSGTIVGVHLLSDGTHNYSASGDFKYNNTDPVPTGATNIYSFFAGLLEASFQKAITITAGLVAGEYAETLVNGMPPATAIRFAEVVSLHRGINATAHKQSVRLVSGVNVTDVVLDKDFSGTTPKWNSVHLLQAPGAVSWTQAIINALKMRFTSSWTAAVAGGEMGGWMMEVEGTGITGGPGDDSGAIIVNHTYGAPGTYPITLRVEDNDGLMATRIINVTV